MVKSSSNLRVMCYVQLTGALVALIFGVKYASVAIEWNHLMDELHPQYTEIISIIREEGIPKEKKEVAAGLFERQLSCVENQPRFFRDIVGVAFACFILLSLLPAILLWRLKGGRTDERSTA